MTQFSNKLQQLLTERNWLLADGAMGSNLFNQGLVSGEAPEIWNITNPERIKKLHCDFMEAGSDIILTNSFGGTCYRLKLHRLENKVREINEKAARIVVEATQSSVRPVVIAGSMGPTGEILQPLGTLLYQDAVSAFAEQAAALQAGGADVLWIETMSSDVEITAALEGAATTQLPIVVTVSFDTNGRSMMGLSAKDLVNLSQRSTYRLIGCGSNCGVGSAETVACIHNLQQAFNPSQQAHLVLIAKGNCGIPQFMNGAIHYNGTPELMAKYATMAYDAGAKIIGGCCGTTPLHVKAMFDALSKHQKADSPSMEMIEAELGEVSRGAKAQWAGDESRLAGSARGTQRVTRHRSK